MPDLPPKYDHTHQSDEEQPAMKLARKDLTALRRCLREVERDAMWADNFKLRRERGDDELTLAHTACTILQSRNLKLEPWEICPADSDPHPLDKNYPDYEARKAEARIFADDMRRAGLSIFEGDPKAALAAAAEKAAARLACR